MKILLGINTLTEVNQMSYMNHLILAYRLGKDFRRHQFQLCAPRRMSIDNMRNFVAKAAIDQEFDYVWFIDDDVLLPEHSLKDLLACKSDVAAGVTLIRGYPFHPMLFSFKEGRKSVYLDEYESLMGEDRVVRRPNLDAVGFSCCLIKVSLLKKISPPWFLTGPNFTEDVYFCNRARQHKPKFTLAATGKVLTEHILGSDTIGPLNRKVRMKYEESLSPELLKKPRRQKRVKPNGKELNAEANRLTGVRAHFFNQIYAEA